MEPRVGALTIHHLALIGLIERGAYDVASEGGSLIIKIKDFIPVLNRDAPCSRCFAFMPCSCYIGTCVFSHFGFMVKWQGAGSIS